MANQQKTALICPCGEHIRGRDEDDLVEKVNAHLGESHEGMSYTRDQILFVAF